MSVEITAAEEGIQARFAGELNRSSCAEAIIKVRKEFERSPGDVLLDMGEVTQVSTFAAAMIARFREFVLSQDRAFRMVNVPAELRSFLPGSPPAPNRVEKQSGVSAEDLAPPPSRGIPSLELPPEPVAVPVRAPQAPAPRVDRERIAGFLTEFEAVFRERDELAKSLSEGVQSRQALEGELKAALEKAFVLTQELESEVQVRKGLDRDLELAREQVLALGEERDAMAQELAKRKEEVSEASRLQAALRKDLEKAKEEKAHVEKQWINARDRAAALSDQVGSLQACLAKIQEALQEHVPTPEPAASADGSFRMPDFSR